MSEWGERLRAESTVVRSTEALERAGVEQHIPGTPEPSPKPDRGDGMVVDLRRPIATIRPKSSSQPRHLYRVGKRALDLTVALLVIVLLSPLLLALAVAVKMSSPGPVFFRQERMGRYGEPFMLLKFRSMVDGADEAYHRDHCEQLANGNGSEMLISADPRVTPLGSFCRKWSCDEIPNLWNVVKGEMSLVGPRPLVEYELRLFQPEQLRRLEVLPGMTGLAQVRGRLEISMDDRADYDLEYVDRCSLLYDMELMLRTIPVVFTRNGA